MATTTTNFGWDIPQSTDLVKDGATAIATLGQDIDTSMADLKGGTTGQILSKASGTDMDFTWINNDQGDITGVTAGTGLTGGGTSGSVTLSIDPDYYLLANQARRNAVLNSNFSVWQRGTSFTGTSPYYGADRWMGARGGAVAGGTWSRQLTNDTTNLPNIQYCIRISRDSGNTNTATFQTTQNFETVNSIPFAGKQVTLSFYARKGANYSGGTLAASVATGTGTDENFVFGYTGSAVPVTGGATLTTTWQRFSFTGTIASTATEMAVDFQWTPTGTAGAADYVEITGVQLEIGSSATTYYPNGNTYQAELAACQRYYQRCSVTNPGYIGGLGSAISTTQAQFTFPSKQTMRVAPTAVEYSSLSMTPDGVGTGIAFSTVTLPTNQDPNSIWIVAGVTGATQYRPYTIYSNASGGYLAISAEL